MSQRVSPGDIQWGAAFARAFRSPPFVVAVIVFAIAAAGMATATRIMEMSFRKSPVPLQQPLEKIPHKLGPWVQVSEDTPLDPDIEHTLGTKTYVFRVYMDSRLVGQDEFEDIFAQTGHDRRREIAKIEAQKPRGVIHFAVTYYTGLVDTVAHVPDRCYIADGYAPTTYEEDEWEVSESEQLRVRFISFEDATGYTTRVPKNVAYVFQVNGDMRSDPVAVRFSLQNLFKSDVYYAKVELMMTNILNPQHVSDKMSDFITHALPEIRKCLPARPGDALEVPAEPEVQAAAATAPSTVE